MKENVRTYIHSIRYPLIVCTISVVLFAILHLYDYYTNYHGWGGLRGWMGVLEVLSWGVASLCLSLIMLFAISVWLETSMTTKAKYITSILLSDFIAFIIWLIWFFLEINDWQKVSIVSKEQLVYIIVCLLTNIIALAYFIYKRQKGKRWKDGRQK